MKRILVELPFAMVQVFHENTENQVIGHSTTPSFKNNLTYYKVRFEGREDSLRHGV